MRGKLRAAPRHLKQLENHAPGADKGLQVEIIVGPGSQPPPESTGILQHLSPLRLKGRDEAEDTDVHATWPGGGSRGLSPEAVSVWSY